MSDFFPSLVMPLDFIAPIEPIEGDFLDKTADIRILDQAQQNIVGVTRQGRSELAKSFSATEMDYGWSAWARLLDGTDTALPYEQTSGPNSTIGYVRDGGTEYMGVNPQITVEMISTNQLRVRHTNLKPGTRLYVGDFWSRGADAYGGWDGDWTVTLPWRQNEAMAFVEIHNNSTGAITGTGLYFRFRGGNVDMSQTRNFGTVNMNGMGWARGTPAQSPGLSVAMKTGDATFLGTTWTSDDVLIQPGKSEDAVIAWTSPATGTVKISGLLQDVQQTLGDGVTYTLRKVSTNGSVSIIQTGFIANGGSMEIPDNTLYTGMSTGDKLELVVNATGSDNDPNNNKGDPLKARLNVELTEAEKTYERVTVAPSIQLRAREDNRVLFIDYRNMPEGVALRFKAKDHYQQSRQMPLPTGTGTVTMHLNDMEPTPNVQVEVFLIAGVSEGGPLEEKKLYFDAQLGSGNPFISNVSTERPIFGSIAHDVLKEQGYTATELDLAEELAVAAYLQYASNPPARDWADGATFNQIEKARQFGALSQSDLMNEPLNGHGELYKIVIPTSPTMFERHTLITDGQANITNVYYVKSDGLYKLPHMYYDRLPNGDIIVKPAELSHIVLEFRLHGHLARSSEQSDNIVDVQPIEGQHVVGGIESIHTQPGGPARWSDMVLDIQQGPSPVLNPGTTVGVFAHIQSIGTEGGNVTLRTYTTYDGNIANVQPQNTLAINLSASGKKAVYFDAHAPLPGPSSDARGIITMEIEYADGRRQILSSRLTRSLGYDEVEREEFMKANAKAYAEKPMYAADGRTVIGRGGVAFNEQQRYVTPNNPVEEEQTLSEVGGSALPQAAQDAAGALASYSQRQLYDEVIDWNDLNNPPLISALPIRRDTAAGKILFGGMNRLWNEQSDYGRWYVSLSMQTLTGIGAEKFTAIRNTSSSVTAFANSCMSLIQEAQYGHLLLNTQSSEMTPRFLSAKANLPVGTPYRSGDIRLRFDFVDGGKEIRRVESYYQNWHLKNTAAAGFINIPLQSIANRLTATPTDPIQVFLRITFEDGTSIMTTSDPFSVAPANVERTVELGEMQHLSRLTENDPNRTIENMILTQISENFPVDLSKGWYNILGSIFHHGNNTHAADLNFGTGNEDEDALIRSIGYGKVKSLSLDGAVTIMTIAYELPNGQKWDARFMHMPMVQLTDNSWNMLNSNNEIVANFRVGEEVSANQVLAANGSEGAAFAHVHFEAHIGDWRSTPAINLDGLFKKQSINIPTKFVAPGRGLVLADFDVALQAWVVQSEKIVLNIVEQNGQAVVQILAKEEGKTLAQMQKIEWKKKLYINDAGQLIDDFIWVSASDGKRWKSDTMEFVPLIPNA